jgi:hypothetical protein
VSQICTDVSEESAASISTHPKDGSSRFRQNGRTYPPYHDSDPQNAELFLCFKTTGDIYTYVCVPHNDVSVNDVPYI